jgi:excisionase family DNA binding protein
MAIVGQKGKQMQTKTKNALQMKEGAVFASVDELAEYIGIGRQAAYVGLRGGTIPSIRVGKRFVLPRIAIEKWLMECATHAH